MKLAQVPRRDTAAAQAGGPEFLVTRDRIERCRELAKRGFLVARVVDLVDTDAADEDAPAPSGNLPLPGQLRTAVEGAIEIALALRGAPPPVDDEELGLRAAAMDKLDRVGVVDAPGLCVVMPPLEAMADPDGVLGQIDSEVLRTYGELATEHPLVMLFDDADQHVQALAPCAIAEVLRSAAARTEGSASAVVARLATDEPATGPAASPSAAAADDAEEAVYGYGWSFGADPLTDVALDAVPFSDRETLIEAVDAAADEAEATRDVDELALAETDIPEADSSDPLAAHHALTLGRLFSELVAEEEQDDAPSAYRDSQAPPEPESAELAAESTEPELPTEGGLFAVQPERSAKEPPVAPSSSEAGGTSDPASGLQAGEANDQPEPAESERPDSRRPPRRAYRSGVALDADTCTRYAQDITDSEGPQPVRRIEEIFQTRYVPLLEVLSSGFKHEGARQAVTRWRKSFEKSYSEGYTTMRLTGKRPPMVLDAPDLAVRAGRLNGARTVQLLLIDGLRFDLGQRVAALLKHRMADRAVCVDQRVLWSAMPTITPAQLRLLARGPRGLREGDPTSEREPMVRRAGSVTTLRRVRIGRRDLLKLDVVEARLRQAGDGFEDRMGALSDEVSTIVAQFATTLSPRTLLYVFGDHGFRLEPTASGGVAQGTQPASQGGASPEEVLVPAYAWLVGKVH